MTPSHHEYTIRPGDSLTRIIYDMYGWTPHNQPTTYRATLKGVLALNPHLKNPDRIAAGTILRLPEHPTSAVLQQVRPIVLKQQGFATESIVSPIERERVTALAWLAHNSNWLTVPGSILTGTTSTLLAKGNQQLLQEISDAYADYTDKKKEINKTTFKKIRAAKTEQFRSNIGPVFERYLYPKKGIKGALSTGIKVTPPMVTAREIARLQVLARHAAKAGVVLTGIGLTAACKEIADAVDQKEKNEIFVDTVASTTAGMLIGGAIGLFLISNPIGWGTALLLATSSAAVSWAAGKGVTYVYDKHGNQIDLVRGTGIDKICRS